SYVPHGGFGAAAGTLLGRPDVLSAATPLAAWRGGQEVPLLGLLTGLRDGAVGESSALLIAAAAVYLIWTKTASWRIILSGAVSGTALVLALHLSGAPTALPPASLLAGSFLFVAVFMATDPVTAPRRPASHWIYGALIGSTAVLIRTFSAFPEGTSFAVLLGNSFAAFIDDFALGLATKRKTRAGSGGAAPGAGGGASE
ncbi:MAG TPA: RnfABCDGE type electron transport complex subunit D, partial [Magnetospirillaceae bacterium]|nr:RnfABCDGE type electron transport complex subunit D [Magnetospirillaceae bacterium]